MMIQALREIYGLSLQALRDEIRAYDSDEHLWKTPGGIANSAGTLALHLTGNLQHFVGAQLGGSGYRRDREAEFARRGASKEELLAEIDAAAAAVSGGFESLTEESLQQLFPEEFRGERRTTAYMLPYLLGHLNYHIGQINYHRRLLGSTVAR